MTKCNELIPPKRKGHSYSDQETLNKLKEMLKNSVDFYHELATRPPEKNLGGIDPEVFLKEIEYFAKSIYYLDNSK